MTQFVGKLIINVNRKVENTMETISDEKYSVINLDAQECQPMQIEDNKPKRAEPSLQDNLKLFFYLDVLDLCANFLYSFTCAAAIVAIAATCFVFYKGKYEYHDYNHMVASFVPTIIAIILSYLSIIPLRFFCLGRFEEYRKYVKWCILAILAVSTTSLAFSHINAYNYMNNSAGRAILNFFW